MRGLHGGRSSLVQLAQVGRGLSYLHNEADMIHGHIKPVRPRRVLRRCSPEQENILVSPDGRALLSERRAGRFARELRLPRGVKVRAPAV